MQGVILVPKVLWGLWGHNDMTRDWSQNLNPLLAQKIGGFADLWRFCFSDQPATDTRCFLFMSAKLCASQSEVWPWEPWVLEAA